MTADLSERIKDSDVVLFDGTLWENEEMATSKVGETDTKNGSYE